MGKSKFYFKGLNGLRFFAAFLVLIYHLEQIRIKYELPNLSSYSFFNNGDIAVEFFFVLSGFLITYLLLEEHNFTGKISIKDFYVRRILRIWPLYYIILFIGLLLIPIAMKILGIEYSFPFPLGQASTLFILFLPNLVFSIWPSNFLIPLWSIGVEEQFYAIWAPLVKLFYKYIIYLFVAIILLRFCFYGYYFNYDKSIESTYSVFLKWINTLKFESMSIGGMGAYIFYKKADKLRTSIVFDKKIQVLLFMILGLRIFFHISLDEGNQLYNITYRLIFEGWYSTIFSSVLFLWLILNVSINPKSLINTEFKILNFLGNISYGIYMYHGIVILILMILIKGRLKNFSLFTSTFIVYVLAVGLTILISHLSYKYIESLFLKLKKKFEFNSKLKLELKEQVQ